MPPDNTTLADFLTNIEDQYGRSDRVWIMDRGIPTEATLETMREADAPVRYLVGTPKGRLTRLEKSFLNLPWQEVHQSVDVKLLTRDGSTFMCRPPTGAIWCCRAIPSRTGSTNCSCVNCT